MAQTPTYQDLERIKTADKVQQDTAAKTAQTETQVGQAIESNKNPILAEYMSRSQGLGVPKDPVEYSELMVRAAVAGQLDPAAVLNDSKVLPEYKNMFYNKVKPQVDSGLGVLQPTR